MSSTTIEKAWALWLGGMPLQQIADLLLVDCTLLAKEIDKWLALPVATDD